MKRPFNIIAAILKSNNGIGKGNKLPWKSIKEDMSFFYKTTVGNKNNAVIMGRKTWESLPVHCRPLKNRFNIVLSKNTSGDLTAGSLNLALKKCYQYKSINDVFVIGGQQVYQEAIQHLDCKNIYLTRFSLDQEPGCDTFFPKIPRWFIKKNSKIVEKKDLLLDFEQWENVSNPTSDENQYLDLVKDIIENGERVETRNGVVRKTFGPQHVFDLQRGFPLLTTKKMFFDGIIKELIFFIRGETNSNILSQQNVNIWKGNTTLEFLKGRGLSYPEGDMGPMYGFNWRHFGANYIDCNSNYDNNGNNSGYDQLYQVIETLVNSKHDRRHLLTTYDPSKVSESVLAPCHGIVTQFYVSNKNGKDYLNCKMYQRSVDVALGYPFNIASYALFVHLLCHVTGYSPGNLIMTLGDTHIYESHINPLLKQLERIPLQQPNVFIKNGLQGNTTEDKILFLENLKAEDVVLENYYNWSKIKMEMVA